MFRCQSGSPSHARQTTKTCLASAVVQYHKHAHPPTRRDSQPLGNESLVRDTRKHFQNSTTTQRLKGSVTREWPTRVIRQTKEKKDRVRFLIYLGTHPWPQAEEREIDRRLVACLPKISKYLLAMGSGRRVPLNATLTKATLINVPQPFWYESLP